LGLFQIANFVLDNQNRWGGHLGEQKLIKGGGKSPKNGRGSRGLQAGGRWGTIELKKKTGGKKKGTGGSKRVSRSEWWGGVGKVLSEWAGGRKGDKLSHTKRTWQTKWGKKLFGKNPGF